jgi:hypothetical protein
LGMATFTSVTIQTSSHKDVNIKHVKKNVALNLQGRGSSKSTIGQSPDRPLVDFMLHLSCKISLMIK